MIVIVTVFRSNNYGSLLQAKVLGDVLKQYDDVCYLDNGKRSYFEWGLVKGIFVAAVKNFKLKKACFLANKMAQNFKGWKKLKAIRNVPKDCDVTYVLGSDEIWNVVKGNCNFEEFWGEGLIGRIFSYAPSVNNSQEKDLREYPFIERNLERMVGISVRDSHSQKAIAPLTKKSVDIVLDPTLLKPLEYYVGDGIKFPRLEKYIAVYIFNGRISQEEKKTVKAFARSKGLKLISVGGWTDWCDCSLPAINQNPFLHYINAEYVVTNTFHGTAFAINFHKQFVTYASKSTKIAELIKLFHLEDRNACGLDVESLDNLFSKKIDYAVVDSIMDANRASSFSFISRTLSEK